MLKINPFKGEFYLFATRVLNSFLLILAQFFYWNIFEHHYCYFPLDLTYFYYPLVFSCFNVSVSKTQSFYSCMIDFNQSWSKCLHELQDLSKYTGSRVFSLKILFLNWRMQIRPAISHIEMTNIHMIPFTFPSWHRIDAISFN